MRQDEPVIVEEIKRLGQIVASSGPESREVNTESLIEILTKLMNSRIYRALNSDELAGIYSGLYWFYSNSTQLDPVIDSEILVGEVFGDEELSIFIVADKLLEHDQFPGELFEYLLANPQHFEMGFTEPDWVATKQMSELQFLRLWNCFGDQMPEFKKGFREQILRNPEVPKELSSLSVWED